jgi:predicted kinase
VKRLILFIGIPGSGKSSLAFRLQQHGCRIVSTDQIRASLFGDASIQGDWRLIWREVNQQLAALHPITVYDATNAKRAARRAVIQLARQVGYDQIIGLWLNPPLALCLAHNQQRSRQVPEAVIRRMHQQLRTAPPKLGEGLDWLIHYDGTDELDWQSEQALARYGNCTSSSAETELDGIREISRLRVRYSNFLEELG